jgi:hypothetical protein
MPKVQNEPETSMAAMRRKAAAIHPDLEIRMDEDKFNMSLRKFLKQVGITSQREIERIVRENGQLGPKLSVKVVLTAEGTDLNHVVEEVLDLG